MDASQKRSLSIRVALISATVLWLASTWFGRPPATPAADTGAPAAVGSHPNLNITLKDDAGKPVSLASFKGKVVLVNLFATWCLPCMAEIPDLVKLQAAHPNDLAVVGLQVIDENGEPLPEFRARLGINYPLLDANDNLDVEHAFGAPDVLPVSIVLDRTGAVVTTLTGRTRLEEFERWVSK